MNELELIEKKEIREIDMENLREYEKEQEKQIIYISKNEFNFLKYGYVYFIITSNSCKIGISSHLFDRITTLRYNLLDDGIEKIYVSKLCSNKENIEKLFKEKFKHNIIKNEFFIKENINVYINFLNSQIYEKKFITNNDYNLYKINIRDKVESLLPVDFYKKWEDLLNIIKPNNYDLFSSIKQEIENIGQLLIYENNINLRLIKLYEIDMLYNLLYDIGNKL